MNPTTREGDMIPDGYIKLWRRCLASDCWKNQKQWRVWTWCLLKATWCEIDQPVGKQVVHLLPGQFVTGRFKAVEETGLSEQEIRNQLNNLQINQQITIKSTNKFSVISIVKWQDYQEESTNKSTSKSPSNQPQTRSIKNTKEVKKEGTYIKEIVIDGLPLEMKEKESFPPYPLIKKEKAKLPLRKKQVKKEFFSDLPGILLSKEEYDKLILRYGAEETRSKCEGLFLYMGSHGKRYVSHYMTILNWDREEKKRQPKQEEKNTAKDCTEGLWQG
jgi:hypothetical protein